MFQEIASLQGAVPVLSLPSVSVGAGGAVVWIPGAWFVRSC